jgi:3-oxoacyl-[acyl-carrier protein] reductase
VHPKELALELPNKWVHLSKVIVNYASSKESADAVVEEIISAGGNAVAIQGDMSEQSDVKHLFEEL